MTLVETQGPVISDLARARLAHNLELQVVYDKVDRSDRDLGHRVRCGGRAFSNAKDLLKEVPCVTTNGIAGARYVSPSDARTIVERRRWPAKVVA
jgi:hypothetical protein